MGAPLPRRAGKNASVRRPGLVPPPQPAYPLTKLVFPHPEINRMTSFARAVVVGLALSLAAGLSISEGMAQDVAKAAPKKAEVKKPAAKKAAVKGETCVRKGGRGWAPTEAMARFQAWEIVAQTTGNWPFMVDTFRNETYKCQPEGAQWKCISRIDVCKKS